MRSGAALSRPAPTGSSHHPGEERVGRSGCPCEGPKAACSPGSEPTVPRRDPRSGSSPTTFERSGLRLRTMPCAGRVRRRALPSRGAAYCPQGSGARRRRIAGAEPVPSLFVTVRTRVRLPANSHGYRGQVPPGGPATGQRDRQLRTGCSPAIGARTSVDRRAKISRPWLVVRVDRRRLPRRSGR